MTWKEKRDQTILIWAIVSYLLSINIRSSCQSLCGYLHRSAVTVMWLSLALGCLMSSWQRFMRIPHCQAPFICSGVQLEMLWINICNVYYCVGVSQHIPKWAAHLDACMSVLQRLLYGNRLYLCFSDSGLWRILSHDTVSWQCQE